MVIGVGVIALEEALVGSVSWYTNGKVPPHQGERRHSRDVIAMGRLRLPPSLASSKAEYKARSPQ